MPERSAFTRMDELRRMMHNRGDGAFGLQGLLHPEGRAAIADTLPRHGA